MLDPRTPLLAAAAEGAESAGSDSAQLPLPSSATGAIGPISVGRAPGVAGPATSRGR